MDPMLQAVLAQLLRMLQLARVTSALAVVGNAWLVVLWTRAEAAEATFGLRASGLGGPAWQPLLASGLVALGLYAFGAAINDILDLRRDRLLSVDRPLAAGALTTETAVWIVVLTSGLAVLGATRFGTRAVVAVLVLQVLVLAYHTAARFVPAVGLVILGVIHAGTMLLPNPHFGAAWPVWMIVTHAMAVAAVAHVVGRKIPRLSRRAVVAAVVGWLALSVVLFRLSGQGLAATGVPAPVGVTLEAAIAPHLMALVFAAWAWGVVRRHGVGSRASEKISRYGTVWMPLYGAAWLAGMSWLGSAGVLLVVAAVASLGVALAREVLGLVSEPVGYRR